jgi:hypothetical protein
MKAEEALIVVSVCPGKHPTSLHDEPGSASRISNMVSKACYLTKCAIQDEKLAIDRFEDGNTKPCYMVVQDEEDGASFPTCSS